MINKLADVQSNCIGDGTTIWQYVVVLPHAQIGSNCNICCHCFIENDVIIGNHVTLKSGVYLWDGITVEDHVFIGPNVTFTNDLYPRSKQTPETFTPTTLRKGSSLGANSTILAGIEIGSYALIGAGSVVTKNIPNNSIWYGNPAELKGYACDCGKRLNASLQCDVCNRQYRLNKEGLIE